MYFNENNGLSDLLHRAVDAETTYINNHLRTLNLNAQQARLLKYIGDHPGTLQKDLATYLNRQSATVTNMLKTMEQRGYIEREIPEYNERQKRLFLLPAGTELVARVATIFTALEKTVSAAVPVRQQALLIEQLQRITAAVAADES